MPFSDPGMPGTEAAGYIRAQHRAESEKQEAESEDRKDRSGNGYAGKSPKPEFRAGKTTVGNGCPAAEKGQCADRT